MVSKSCLIINKNINFQHLNVMAIVKILLIILIICFLYFKSAFIIILRILALFFGVTILFLIQNGVLSSRF